MSGFTYSYTLTQHTTKTMPFTCWSVKDSFFNHCN